MRTIILALLFIPFTTLAQKGQEVYLKLTDASGQQIKGDAVARGHERSIGVLSFATAGKNNSQLSFSMNITGASADLKRAMGNGSLLLNGQVSVMQSGVSGMPATLYTIKMENIRVNNCAESMGCNGITTTSAVLTATRIGWTYYQTDGSGKQTVSRKYGFDSDTGREWTNF
ncbi:MAG: type VI secretion system tube protein Hcp [Chitinophagaceae bacterium]|nr:type VI secretion system tube protein Hcp [Chitinophagaceae bacterium]